MLVLFFNKDKKSMDEALDENDIFCGHEEKQLIKARLKEPKHMKLVVRLEEPCSFHLRAD